MDRDFFQTRCDNQTVYWELVRAGCGLGFGHRHLGRLDARLEEIRLDLPMPELPIWLAKPNALKNKMPVNRVWDHLANELPPFL